MITVAVVDDDAFIRETYAEFVQAATTLELKAVFSDGRTAVAHLAGSPVDVVLLDIRMPGWDGLETARRLNLVCPATKIVFVTTFDDDTYLQFATETGHGFMLKSVSATDLENAIESTFSDLTVVTKSVARRLAPMESVPALADLDLTEMELNLMSAICSGATNQQIAQEFGYSLQSIKTFITNLFKKCGVKTRVQLVLLVNRIRYRLPVDPDDDDQATN